MCRFSCADLISERASDVVLSQQTSTPSFLVCSERPPLLNLTAYIVDGGTLSVTWDVPADVHDIDRVYITVTELADSNRTIQQQALDGTIKKLDLPINGNDAQSIQPNSTVHFAALYSDRNGQNSSAADYELHINTWSEYLFSFFRRVRLIGSDVDRMTSCCRKRRHTFPRCFVTGGEKSRRFSPFVCSVKQSSSALNHADVYMYE